MTLLEQLKADPEYRKLSVPDQMLVADRLARQRLFQDPEFARLPTPDQDFVLKRLVAEAPTIDHPEVDRSVKDTGRRLLSGQDPTFGDVWTRFMGGAVEGSGVMGWLLDKVVKPYNEATQALGIPQNYPTLKDQQRGIDYLKEIDRLSDRTSYAQGVGSLFSSMVEAVGVGRAMAPLTGKFAGAGIAKLRGLGAGAKGAEILTKPVLHPALEMLTPIMADAVTTAAPLYLLEELRRAENGDPSVIGQGAFEIAKTLGKNAAENFVWGTATTLVGGALIRGVRKVYLNMKGLTGDLAKDAFEGTKKVLEEYVATGDDTILEQMAPVTADGARQTRSIYRARTEGAADREAWLLANAQEGAVGTGRILAQTDAGNYRVWYPENGQSAPATYDTLVEAENSIALHAYSDYLTKPVEKQAAIANSPASWILPRGQLLSRYDALLSSKNISEMDPELAAYGARKPLNIPAKDRVAVTKAEADWLSKSPSYEVIQAKLPLEGTVFDNLKSGSKNLFRNSSSVRVPLSNSDAPNIMFIGLSEAPEQAYWKALDIAGRATEVGHRPEVNEALSSIMLNWGFDHYVNKMDGTVTFFAPRSAKLIATADEVFDAVPLKPKVAEEPFTKIEVQAKTDALISGQGLVKNKDLLVQSAVTAIRSGKTDDLRNLAKIYLEAFNKNADITVRQVEGKMEASLIRSGNSFVLEVPKSVFDIRGERRFVSSLFATLDEAVQNAQGSNKGSWFAKSYDREVLKFGIPVSYNPTPWLEDVAQKLGGTYEERMGKHLLALPSGLKEFNSVPELQAYLARKTAEPSLVVAELRKQGIRLEPPRVNGGEYRAFDMKANRPLASSRNLETVLEAIGYEPRFMDAKFGPSNVKISKGYIEFELAGTRYAKDRAEAMKVIDMFRDTNFLTRKSLVKALEAGDLAVEPNGNYTVTLNRFGYSADFSNYKDASRFLEKDALDFDELSKIADRKGLDLSYRTDTGYQLHDGKTKQYAKTQSELAELLKAHPDPVLSARNILDDLDPQIEIDAAEAIAAYRQADFLEVGANKLNLPPVEADAKPIDAWHQFRQYTSGFTSWIRDVARRFGRPELGKIVDDFERAVRFQQRDQTLGARVIAEAFLDEGGRELSKESRQKIWYHLVQDNEKIAKGVMAQYESKFGKALEPLTESERYVSSKVKEYLDAAALKFGIRFEDLIGKYMPMLRDWTLESSNASALSRMNMAEDLFEAMKDRIPDEVRFWAEEERLNDFLGYALKDDPLELLLLYNAKGTKKLHLNAPWKAIYGYARANNLVEVDNGLWERINTYREQVMGIYHSKGEKVAEELGAKFMTGLKSNPVTAKAVEKWSPQELDLWGRSLVKKMLGLGYFGQMSWKGFLAFRNSFQPFTTFSMRYGTAYTLAAYDKVLKQGRPYFEGLASRGILPNKPYLIDEAMQMGGKTAKFAEKGMQWLKNSDDLNRAVAYEAASMRFEEGLKYLEQNPTDLVGFQKLSGLTIVDPVVRNKTMDFIKKGRPDAALDYYAFNAVKETSMPSGQADAALIRTGLPGRLFGMYGSYTEAYRANMFAMLKYGSKEERVKMIATYLALAGVISAAFAGMKIKTKDFFPAAPAFINPGPLFELGVDIVKAPESLYNLALGTANSEDRRNLSNLKYSALGYVPGSAQFGYLAKAQKYASQGDYYRAWLAASGVSPLTE